jgi:hypothetical protein
MPTEEERIAADEARIAVLAGAATEQEAPAETGDDTTDEDQVAASGADGEDEPQAAAADSEDQNGADGGTEDEPAPPAAAPAPRGSRTLEGRISKLAADKRALQAEVARLKAAGTPAAADQDQETAPPADGTAPQRSSFATQDEFDAAVDAAAAARIARQEFNRQCNEVEDKGSKLGARWDAAKRNLALLDDNGVIPYALLSVALETEDPSNVLLQLGEDPDRAQELLDMTPTRRAMEISKMSSQKAPTPPPASRAPPPVDPIRGRGAGGSESGPSDKDDDEAWLKKRNEQLLAKRRAEAARHA